MKKIFIGTLFLSVLLTSCVSNKKYADLETQHNKTKQDLVDTKAELQACLVDKDHLMEKNKSLEADKARSIQQVENLTVLTQSSSDNIKEVIAQLSEKDKYINGVRDAMTKKDSINLALAFQLKKDLAKGIQDEDIQIEVEKTVVYISIADKMLFKSGSSTVSDRAKEVLGKVATVVNSKPEMEVQVEGYTDNVPINTDCMKDNWDLSVARATSVVRVLQNDFSVDSGRLIAAGRSEYVPLASNDTAEGRSINRRTRIVILPKLEEFFDILEQKPE
ncbi:OmpA family protein [Lutimonas saemankumensis]|uniref:OmpA/MotB family protein n=1 Tax=Lutimonas saemankumensis TaxID=483016 RepID=UPI001CD7CDC4|nr:OmpA family protein [Lutimonas saemankumensis]MCA0933459.1 OmpA family protein [Lutimonas saemankumensis]